MSSLFKSFKMDHEKEINGVRIEMAPNDDKTIPTFTVARSAASNPRYMKSLERFTRAYRRQIDTNMLDNMIADKIRRDVFIDSVLIGWEHIQDEQGKEIEFTPKNAEALFSALPELFNDLETQSKQAALYRAEDQEKEAKN